MNKTIIYGFVFLLLAVGTIAVPPFQSSEGTQTNGFAILYPKLENFKLGQTAKLHFHLINLSTGYPINITKANCSFHLYNGSDNHILKVDVMDKDTNDRDYEQNINTTPVGRYFFNVWCYDHAYGGYVSGFYDVTPYGIHRDGGDGIFFGVLSFLPLILTIILLVGSVSLHEEHNALKIALFLLSPVTLIIALNFGMLALSEFYYFEQFQDVIGSSIYWITLVWVTIMIYFIIYLIYKAINTAAQKKKERLEY